MLAREGIVYRMIGDNRPMNFHQQQESKGTAMTIRIFSMLCALLFAGSASAQAFPTKPVTIVVPYASRGPADVVARTGQPVLIDSKPGANERIATEYLLRQTAFGVALIPRWKYEPPFRLMPYWNRVNVRLAG